MSHNTLAPETGETAPASDDARADGAESHDALIRRARDIITGRVQPAPMVAAPELWQRILREFAHEEQQPTPAALQRMNDWLCLETQFGGEPVVYFTTPAGYMVVLGCGESEIRALLRGLPVEEVTRVVVTDTAPYWPR
jgi:hypothetical protein